MSTYGESPYFQSNVDRVSDEGNGMNDMEIAKSLNFFFTTHKWRENDSYTYSGNFGAPIAGLGVGLPMSQLYAESFGGSLSVRSFQFLLLNLRSLRSYPQARQLLFFWRETVTAS